MGATSDDLVMQACRQQFEMAAAMIEAITEGSKQMREVQLRAAAEACAGAQALHKQIAEAGDAQALWRIQNEWVSANLARTLVYWRELYQVALAAQSSIARQMSAHARLPATQAPAAALGAQGSLFDMMDTAYKRWLESTRQLYAPPSGSTPQLKQTA
jgi:hypothetical protein